jgi:alginate O-acetyltransferase complex protein AlgI
MLFTSPIFLFIFLPIFMAIYYLSKSSIRTKNHLALTGSVIFFVIALLLGTYIDYRISLIIAPNSLFSACSKRTILTLAICFNIFCLIASKYLDFIIIELITPLNPWTGIKIEPAKIPLLLGISFITFHRISYLIDSFKGRAIPPRGFLDCALYIFLFPQLIAGPIIRYLDIGEQIHYRVHTAAGFLTGFFRFAVGISKKVIFADPMGLLADKIFLMPTEGLYSGFAWVGILAYTLQIYFDFSAYSDMAIGLGKMMGFRFPENFNRPYTSLTITEFWRRWHISLSSWMRLYLYIPLGGNKGSRLRTYANLWIVFLLSGLWHGASWNFIAWGAFHGLLLTLDRVLSDSWLSKFSLHSYLKQLWTLFMIMIGWVFFRSPTLTHAIGYLGVLFGFESVTPTDIQPWGMVIGNKDVFILVLGAFVASARLPGKRSNFPISLKAAWTESMTIQGTL